MSGHTSHNYYRVFDERPTYADISNRTMNRLQQQEHEAVVQASLRRVASMQVNDHRLLDERDDVRTSRSNSVGEGSLNSSATSDEEVELDSRVRNAPSNDRPPNNPNAECHPKEDQNVKANEAKPNQEEEEEGNGDPPEEQREGSDDNESCSSRSSSSHSSDNMSTEVDESEMSNVDDLDLSEEDGMVQSENDESESYTDNSVITWRQDGDISVGSSGSSLSNHESFHSEDDDDDDDLSMYSS